MLPWIEDPAALLADWKRVSARLGHPGMMPGVPEGQRDDDGQRGEDEPVS